MSASSKLYAFNASSFSLDARTVEFLNSKGALAIDFGSYAYISAEAMPAILSELVAKAAATVAAVDNQGHDALAVQQLRSELARQTEERQRLIVESSCLAMQARSFSSEILALKEQLSAAGKTIEALKSENARLQSAVASAAAAAPKAAMHGGAPAKATATTPVADSALRQSHEKLLKEFQQLRSQSIEAITSLKVLEEENAALQEEVEALRAQVKNASHAPPKAA
jgi:chromosome segregation ATPase